MGVCRGLEGFLKIAEGGPTVLKKQGPVRKKVDQNSALLPTSKYINLGKKFQEEGSWVKKASKFLTAGVGWGSREVSRQVDTT